MKPTNTLDLAHWVTGWNDIANGLLDWTGSDAYPTPREWAQRMAEIARHCLPEAKGSHNRAYYEGCIDAAARYIETGLIEREE
jgi:hypothetical protein